MAGTILDNGMAVTLGLVAAVAAVGAATRRGSAARRSRVQDGVYSYTSATGSQLVLKGPGAPNLDAMTSGELMAFWHATYTGGWEIARFLFPDRPKGYLRATELLGAYASNRATAKTLRAEKKPKDAEMYERIAASIYMEFPGYAVWTQNRGSRATLDERVADLQFDMTTLFGARETKRPSELKRMRERVLTENADLLRRIQTQKERGIDTRLLERDLRARMR